MNGKQAEGLLCTTLFQPTGELSKSTEKVNLVSEGIVKHGVDRQIDALSYVMCCGIITVKML